MAKLRVDKIAAVGVSTETTGSVYFDGTGDYLTLANSTDFNYGSSDFSIEAWVYYPSSANDSNNHGIASNYITSGNKRSWLFMLSGNTPSFIGSSDGTSGNNVTITSSVNVDDETWTHIAVSRTGTTVDLYVNGIKRAGTTSFHSSIYSNTDNPVEIGGYNNGTNTFDGYISNLRICKGHAVYTSQFIPPTRELEVHQGPDDDRTVLLACYDGENIFAEKTGRHIIAAYGDRTSSPTPTATDSPIGITTNYPPVTRSVDPTAGPTFQGGVGFVSQNWLTLPKGTTTERDSHGGHRGLFMGGTSTNTIDYVVISTTGNAVDFGDLISDLIGNAACSSSTRGISAGGLDSPALDDTIEFVTIATLGNAIDFGNLTDARRNLGASSNSIRGLFFGGSDPGVSNIIDYITIASTGNAIDFGDISSARTNVYGCASPTRGILGGGETPSAVNTIEYVTIASTGDAQDFGDLSQTRSRFASTGSGTRGVFASGRNPSNVNTIDYVTIASTGNANDFGDVTLARQNAAATSDSVRGVFAGGYTSSDTNTIDFTVIPAMGNAQDFGDLTAARREFGACSSGHGGLG